MDTTTQAAQATRAGKTYAVKCDDCKTTMRRTTDVRESHAGGRCEKCRAEADAAYLRRQSPHTCDPVKVAAALAAIWGAR